jgi:hypothetical protein
MYLCSYEPTAFKAKQKNMERKARTFKSSTKKPQSAIKHCELSLFIIHLKLNLARVYFTKKTTRNGNCDVILDTNKSQSCQGKRTKFRHSNWQNLMGLGEAFWPKVSAT